MGGRGASSLTSKLASRLQGGHIVGPFKKDALTASYLDISPERANEINDSIRYWSGSGYRDIRNVVDFGPNEPLSAKSERDIAEYLSKAPVWNGGTTYRGIRLGNEPLPKPGEIIDMKGHASWTSDKGVALSFAGSGINGFQPVIFTSKTQSKGTSIAHLVYSGFEREVLVSKSATYRVDKIEKSNMFGRSITLVHLSEITNTKKR
ncbi:MAG: ADP-ribosyltransferase [Coriobacteriaceae bacterium]|jgi:hypothetical protein|nr:ADP-ribosyltransferase [Coriobacteriaceae bacterium]